MEIVRVSLDKVVYDGKIYPRDKPSTATIDEYADALAAGASFPPIILEEGTNRLLDGYHRWKAHAKYRDGYQSALGEATQAEGEPLPEPSGDIAVVYHAVPEETTAKLYALSLSVKNGLRIASSDKETAAQEAYGERPGMPTATIGKYLGVPNTTVWRYLKELTAAFEETRQTIIQRLAMLGWTQQEIADQLTVLYPNAKGTTQRTVSGLLEESSNWKKLLKADLDRGHSVDTVAKRHNTPDIMAWAIKLDGMADADRLELLKVKVQPFDVWAFQGSSDLFGSKYPGRIPGQLVAHVLYFYTQLGDLVIDPMVGSGTTLDVCLALGRRCYGFDAHPLQGRPDIMQHDAAVLGWPERTADAKLIFWDPPYYKKVDSGYGDKSVSRFNRADYLAFFNKMAREIPAKFKGRLAFLCSDFNNETDPSENIFYWEYVNLFAAAGWYPERRIQTPLSTQQVHPDTVNKFRKARRLARLNRDLLIFSRQPVKPKTPELGEEQLDLDLGIDE